MISPENPYITDRPVRSSDAFIGRTEILTGMAETVRTPDSRGTVLYGYRRMGKTSLLLRLSEQLSEQDSCVPVYLDLNDLADLTPEQVFARLGQHILKASGLSEPESGNADFFARIIDRLPADRTIILLLDEFAPPAGSEPGKRLDFYRRLREFMDRMPPRIKIVPALGRAAEDMERICKPLFSDLPVCHLPVFSADETAQTVHLAEQNRTLFWPDEQTAAVGNFTGGHPWLVQNLCRTVWNRIYESPPEQIPEVWFKHMGGAFSQAMKDADRTFQWIWEGLGPGERLVMSVLAKGGSAGVSQAGLEQALRASRFFSLNGELSRSAAMLQKPGIVQAEDGIYRLNPDMMCRWIMARKPVERIESELANMAGNCFRQAALLYEKGEMDEAAVLLKHFLSLSPENTDAASLLLSKILIRKGRLAEAVPVLEQLCERNVNGARAAWVRVLLRQAEQGGNDADRLLLYEKILKQNPEQPEALAGYRKIVGAGREKNDDAENFHAEPDAGWQNNSEEKADMTEPPPVQPEGKVLKIHRKPQKSRRWMFWAGGFLLFMGACGFLGLYAIYRHYSVELPDIHSLRDYAPPMVTTVYSDDNRKIAEFYRERRIVVPLEQIPENLINAFISAEDSRYFSHEGVDFLGIIRAFFKNIEAGSIVQGGSTITQQVVKSLLLTPEKSYERKIREALLAWRIEKRLTKKQILGLYLNQIYLGNGAYGVAAASENYFGKKLKHLTLAECALLAGLTKAPSRDMPVKYPERAIARQHYVLSRMASEGHVTREAAEAAMKEPLKFKTRRDFYSEEVPYFSEYIRQYIEERYGWELLYTGGLKVYTTVNIEMQKAARAAVEKGLTELEARNRYAAGLSPQGAMLCMEIGTGYIRAMVGGRDFKLSQFNRVTQSRRQPGSAFKPIIYGAALEKGFTPMTILYDTPLVIPSGGELWKPGNYDGKYSGALRLRKALAKSRNIPAIKVMRSVGIEYTVDYARRLGITSRLYKGLPLALGSSGVSLMELVNAYSVFANQGKRVLPVFITCIQDRNGNELMSAPLPSEQVIEPAYAFLMTSLLQSVVNEGTAYRVKREFKRQAAGKTGTTNDFRDAWFVGYTPEYIAGAWVGFDQERPLGKSETGSSAAIPIWLDFMKKILDEKPVQEFPPPPEDIMRVSIDSGTDEWFRKGQQPARTHTPRYEGSGGSSSPRKKPNVVNTPADLFKNDL